MVYEAGMVVWLLQYRRKGIRREAAATVQASRARLRDQSQS